MNDNNPNTIGIAAIIRGTELHRLALSNGERYLVPDDVEDFEAWCHAITSELTKRFKGIAISYLHECTVCGTLLDDGDAIDDDHLRCNCGEILNRLPVEDRIIHQPELTEHDPPTDLDDIQDQINAEIPVEWIKFKQDLVRAHDIIQENDERKGEALICFNDSLTSGIGYMFARMVDDHHRNGDLPIRDWLYVLSEEIENVAAAIDAKEIRRKS